MYAEKMRVISAAPRPDDDIDLKGQYQPVPSFEQRNDVQLLQSELHSNASRQEPPTCVECWLRGDFTILPEGKLALDAWDMVVISALVVTAVAVPFEVALVDNPSTSQVVVSKIIDLIFTIDMILTFFLASVVEQKGAASVEVYETRPLFIAKRYMAFPFSDNFQAGWFWPDLLTILPWDYIASMGIMGMQTKSIRLIRVLRLLRMLRLVRVWKLFKRWHVRSGFPFAALKILTCTSVTLLLVHWLACTWGHIGLKPGGANKSTWLTNHLTGDSITDLSTSEIYVNALYLCATVLTSVGFGDIVPTNDTEEVCMIITLFFTGVTWSWVVANVVAVITNMDMFGTAFNQTMDDLNALMSTHGVKNSLKLKVRRHVHESYRIQRERHHHNAIKWLSAGLQGELAMQSGVDQVCERIFYLRDLPEEVIVELADEFVGDLFSPGEIIMDHDSVCVIRRGSCIRRGKMLTQGSVFGEDIILITGSLRDTICPRTLTFLEVMKLHRDSLLQAAAKFPVLDHRLRRAQIKLALRRSFIQIAAKVREGNMARKSKTGVSTWETSFFSACASSQDRSVSKGLTSTHTWSWVGSMSKDTPSPGGAPEALQEATDRMLLVLEQLSRTAGEARSEAQQRYDAFDNRFSSMETRLSSIESRLGQLSTSQSQIMIQTSQGSSPSSPTSPAMKKKMFPSFS